MRTREFRLIIDLAHKTYRVIARLDESGYGQIVRWLRHCAHHKDWRDFENMKVFKNPKELTDRSELLPFFYHHLTYGTIVWSNAKPLVEDFLNERRDLYDQDRWDYTLNFRMQLLTIIAGIFFNCEDSLHAPRAADLVSIPSIRAMVEKPMGKDDEPDDFHPDRIMEMLQTFDPKTLLDICINHRRAVLAQLACSYWNSETSFATRHIDAGQCLKLAVTVFQCTASKFAQCSVGYMSYDEALVHQCRIIDWVPSSRFSDEDQCIWMENTYLTQMERSTLYKDHHRDPYGKVAISRTGSRAIWNLVELANADPHTTTFADMDKLDPWFSCECDLCVASLSRGLELVFDWRHVVI